MDLLQMLGGGVNPQKTSLKDIQGRTNPGYIPLQNSGQGGKGYTSNLQPARNPQAGQQLQMRAEDGSMVGPGYYGSGRKPSGRAFAGGQGSVDNQITNQMIQQGQIPASQAEIYSQQMAQFTPTLMQNYPNNLQGPSMQAGLPANRQQDTWNPAAMQPRGNQHQDPLAILRQLLGF